MNTFVPRTDNAPFDADGDGNAGTGFIIIRLARRHTADFDRLLAVAEAEHFNQLHAFLSANPQYPSARVIRHTAPALIRERESSGQHGAFPPIESLTAYWRIDVRAANDPESIRQELASMNGEIAAAYRETAVVDAFSDVTAAGDNDYFDDQEYLQASPFGIGAIGAWDLPGCDGGMGVNVIDLEAGWILTHEDLPAPALLYGDDGTSDGYTDGNHGAAIMGVIGAVNNDAGVIGVAPNIASLHAISHYDADAKTGLHVADAISAAIERLSSGDVLVLPVQRHADSFAYPIETDSADFHAIRAAVNAGIVVIEAAGNGGKDLDEWKDLTDELCLDRNSNDFTDSGAIMVGSSDKIVVYDNSGSPGHRRYSTSNFGSRVDVYAWGERICTAGYGTLAGADTPDASYARNFGQTSGASAIIAGAAALVQSRYRNQNGGTSLTSEQMRAILANPLTATRQSWENGENIGVMPDLTAVFSATP